jgi:hypothetical protein
MASANALMLLLGTIKPFSPFFLTLTLGCHKAFFNVENRPFAIFFYLDFQILNSNEVKFILGVALSKSGANDNRTMILT